MRLGILELRRLLLVVGGGLLMVGAAAMSMPAFAADGPTIARTNACMGCHAVDRKLVGPSFQQIAEKYKGVPGAQAKLMLKVKDGGSGVWGPIPMPSHPSMSDADINTVVGWVLAGAPGGK
jgi:cytochrome c